MYSPNYYAGSFLLPRESNTVLNTLDQGDQITFMAKQRMISADVFAPSVIITTSKKLIIVSRPLAGLKSSIAFIPYQDIVGVRIAHGMLVSSVHIKMKSSLKEGKSPIRSAPGDEEIKALDAADADILFAQLNNIVNLNVKPDGAISYYSNDNMTNNGYIENNFKEQKSSQDAIRKGIGKERQSGRYHIDLTSLHRFMPDKKEKVLVYTVPIDMQPKKEDTQVTVEPDAPTKEEEEVQSVSAEDLLIFKNRKKEGIGILSRLSLMVNRNAN